MESNDKVQIELLAKNNPELQRLYELHQRYHAKIDGIERRKFITPKEERELKELKAMKLRGVERMMAMVSDKPAKAPAENTQGFAA